MDEFRGRAPAAGDGAQRFHLSGQARVFEAWQARIGGSGVLERSRLNMAALAPEMAHVCVLARTEEGFRFRLSGSGLRQAFGRDARGLRLNEVELGEGGGAWADAANIALDERQPVCGRTITEDGRLHFWLRLPMSSDGGLADMVLCHDRYLPHDAADDPEAAAKAVDRAMRRDSVAQAA